MNEIIKQLENALNDLLSMRSKAVLLGLEPDGCTVNPSIRFDDPLALRAVIAEAKKLLPQGVTP